MEATPIRCFTLGRSFAGLKVRCMAEDASTPLPDSDPTCTLGNVKVRWRTSRLLYFRMQVGVRFVNPSMHKASHSKE